MNIKNGASVAVFLAIGLVGLPITAHGQGARARVRAEMAQSVGESFEGRVDATRTFGLNTVSHTVSGAHFTGFEMSYPDVWDTNDSGSRSCAIQGCILVAPFDLPAGALITAIELNAVDSNATKDVVVVLRRTPINEGSPVVLATVASSGTPGPTFVTTALPSPHTVDNVNNTYSLTYTGADDNTTKVQAVRVFYNLQISPAPAFASFTDVPTTHPFFQFVQALAAAGITGGCGGGQFCPDNPVTRGQMAAFLSRALGLHFAP